MSLPQAISSHLVGPSPKYTLASGWTLLTEVGIAVADLAGLEPGVEPMPAIDFATRASAAGPSRLTLAEAAIDDLAAILHAGLTAITAASAAGRDTTRAAYTLWCEFVNARESLMALTAPPA